jgi:hypothetical protein
MRFHTPDLKEKHPDMYETVKHHMSWYVSRVQKQYPSLIHVKYSLLMSNPNAERQSFHYDYEDHVTNKDPERQPVSLIAALDPFDLNIVIKPPSYWEYAVDEGDAIIFTNKAEHGGGANNYQIKGKPAQAVRLFAYMVSNERDFPSDTVQYAIDEDEVEDKDEEEEVDEDEEEEVDEDEESSIPPVAAKKSKVSAAVRKMASGGRTRKPTQKAKEAAVAGEGRKRTGSKTTTAAALRIITTTTAKLQAKPQRKECAWSYQAGRKPCDPHLPPPLKCSISGCNSLVHQQCINDWENGMHYTGPGHIVCPKHHEYYQSVGGGKVPAQI